MKTTKRNKKDLIDIDIIDLNGSSKDGGKKKSAGKKTASAKKTAGGRSAAPGQKLRAEKRPRAKAPKAARAALARQLPVESPQHRYAGRATGSLRLLPTFFWRCLSVSPDILSISYNLRVRISSTIPTTPDWRPCRTRSSGGRILSADGQVLARTDVAEDGTETRVYPYGPMFAHAVGYNVNGMAGGGVGRQFQSAAVQRLCAGAAGKRDYGSEESGR